MKYKIWNKTDTLVSLAGEEFTAEQIFAKYAWAKKSLAKCIIADDIIELKVFMEFNQTKDFYKKQINSAIESGTEGLVVITDTMTDEEVLNAISVFEDTPIVTESTAEERIAAQLEFQSMMAD